MEICFAFNIISFLLQIKFLFFFFSTICNFCLFSVRKILFLCFPFGLFLVVLCPWCVLSQYASSNVIGILNNEEQSSLPVVNQHYSAPTSNENYLVGNLSQPFTFQVAPPSIKVTYLGLNGLSLYISSVGFSNNSKFHYDEQNNRLTILSLDQTTVGTYLAVNQNWKTFTNILSAINVSSFQIHNSHLSEDNNGSSFVSCSVSIIRPIFKLSESNFQAKTLGIENLPRLDLFVSSMMSDKKLTNDSLNEQNVTRTITLQRRLTRADHNGTIQCRIESNNNMEIYLQQTRPINIEYGPNLEAGASERDQLQSEVSKMLAMECQVEANPSPSYVWYEMIDNQTSAMSVFGTTRQLQRVYTEPGHYAMQCQAQSRGKTVKQEFFIHVLPQSNLVKSQSDIDRNQGKSSKLPIIIGISIGCLLLLLGLAIVIATLIHLRRQKMNPEKKISTNNDKSSPDRSMKPRWGNLPVDYSKYKNEASSSTSHLVESAETNSIQAPPPIPARPSPMTSTHSSYRQAPSSTVSLSYRQASALPGFRLPPPVTREYSPEQDDEVSVNMNPMGNNRLRTKSPFGSRKSLSESIQSLKSNQQAPVCLPTKKRANDLPAKLSAMKADYQNHHYQNPAELQTKTDNTSSEEEEPSIPSTYNQQPKRRNIPRLSPTKMMILSDEIPPSYQQVSNTSSPAHAAYAYQEPTEV